MSNNSNNLEEWLINASGKEAQVLMCRNLLRQLECFEKGFEEEYSGWAIFSNFNYLRLLHNTVACVFLNDKNLYQPINSASKKLVDDLIHGEWKPYVLYGLTILTHITPKKISTSEGRKNLFKEHTKQIQEKLSLTSRGDENHDFLFLKKNNPNLVFQIGIYRENVPSTAKKVLFELSNNKLTKSYWHDWYQGFLDGKPLDWNLQREVALIPDADWEKGPAHIAGVIELIRKKYDLKARVVEAKAVLAEYETLKTPSMGHNHPPEGIDDIPFGSIEFNSIRKGLNELEEELEKPEIDKSKLKSIAKTIGNISLKIAVWLAKKMDIALDEFFKEIGKGSAKWAIRVVGVSGGVYLIKLTGVLLPVSELLQSLIAHL